MKATNILRRLIFVLALIVSVVIVKAQGDPGGDPGGGPIGAIPVDGGLALMLAAGVGYGAKKAYERRKTSKL